MIQITSEIFEYFVIALVLIIGILKIKYEIDKFKKDYDIKPGDFKTKEEEDDFLPDYEKVEKAEDIINNPQPMVPGFGNQNPIKAPTEEVEIYPSDMPWELENAEDAKDEDS